MARKIDKPVYPEEAAALAEKARAASEADALDVLHPERTLTIADRTVTIREYGHIEGRQLAPGITGFLDDLYAEYKRDEPAPKFDTIDQLIDRHIVVVQWMVAHAITALNDDDPEAFISTMRENAKWVAKLDDTEGDLLLLAWWSVNKGFFTRRLQRRDQAEQLARGKSASPRSTPP